MKKNRLAAGALALAVSITACGCGDQIYELTEEEEAVIVHYAAHAVSKFNKRQTEGIQNVAVLKMQMEQKEKEAKEQKEREKRQEEQEKEQNKQPEDAQSSQEQTPDNPAAQPEETVDYVSLSQALKLGGVNAVYRKYEVTPSYQASASYMVRANSGNELLVLYVDLKNSGSKTAKCDILSKMPSFRLKVNGELSVSADTTILLNDLGTYQGNIKAGNKARTVLVFQMKKGMVKTVNSMDLEVTVGETSSLVQLVK